MKKVLIGLAVMGLMLSNVSSVFAIKQLKDHFVEMYAGDEANEDFKALVDDAKCNVCHVYRENKKKVRNPYGEALHELLEEKEFPLADFKKNPDEYKEQLSKIFKAIEEKDSAYEGKTFKDRIEANLLPGGDVKGKKD